MIIIYEKNGAARVIRPCPLISISYNANRNKSTSLGGYYDITLNGTLITNRGSPYQDGLFSQVYELGNQAKLHPEIVTISGELNSIFNKQNALRELFANDGQRFEVCDILTATEKLVFFPTLQSINFEEGVYTNICKYTVNLRADLLFDNAGKVISDSRMFLVSDPSGADVKAGNIGVTGDTVFAGSGRFTLDQELVKYGGFVEDFSENWSLEYDDGYGNTFTPDGNGTEHIRIRSYRLTRNISATGKTIYGPSGTNQSNRYEAWQQAKSFVGLLLKGGYHNNYGTYPKLSLEGYFAKDVLNIASGTYGGYNHSRTENIDKTAGSYSVTETWLISSGIAFENYSMSISSSNTSSLVSVSIDGTIKGLTSISSSGSIYGGSQSSAGISPVFNEPYENAVQKYHRVSNSGNFGPTSYIFKRAQSSVPQALNSQPLSFSLGSNPFTGEITYNVQFDTRPANYISGVLSESINIQDTYPGDVFATIPVLGRSTGPVLQFLGTRTEYQRNLGIDIIVDTNMYSNVADLRTKILLTKPILREPTRSGINNLIVQVSPAREPGIRKYFLSPPSESWDAKEGRYTLNLTWTYELDS